MKRWEENNRRTQRLSNYQISLPASIAVLLIIVGLAVAIPTAYENGDAPGLAVNIGTELFGGGLLYLLLEEVQARIQERTRLKTALIEQLQSPIRDIALHAIEELRRRGWLQDGTLQGINLWEANLREVDLSGADLKGAQLGFANLKGANLAVANFESAQLGDSYLQGAILTGANLKQADLESAVLWGALLTNANLEGAILPNGDKWHPGYDMSIFTNPPDDGSDE